MADRVRMNTCLHWAVTYGRAECIMRLLDSGIRYHQQVSRQAAMG